MNLPALVSTLVIVRDRSEIESIGDLENRHLVVSFELEGAFYSFLHHARQQQSSFPLEAQVAFASIRGLNVEPNLA